MFLPFFQSTYILLAYANLILSGSLFIGTKLLLKFELIKVNYVIPLMNIAAPPYPVIESNLQFSTNN